jgi:ribose/xylose/arabinose/galactoside ABC-type transport system permease subunit
MSTTLTRPTTNASSTHARVAAASLASASLLAIAGFTVLGIVFEYPQILEEPTRDVLSLFRENQTSVTTWFLVLAVSAALMAPAGIALGRLAGGRLGRWIAIVGIAAATVQVIGLQRWITLVPGIAKDALDPAAREDAEARFELFHMVLGKVVGETIGYALTAVFTVLVVLALRRTVLPRWAAAIGYTAAALIATGIAVPLVPAASLTNFAGYVAWCAWLLLVSWLLVRPYAAEQASVFPDSQRTPA